MEHVLVVGDHPTMRDGDGLRRRTKVAPLRCDHSRCI